MYNQCVIDYIDIFAR